uniref:Uncharacterized protein n=1 Tax=Avena sativa TaxID=4498 RepID=A0ACD5YVI7_AVESA
MEEQHGGAHSGMSLRWTWRSSSLGRRWSLPAAATTLLRRRSLHCGGAADLGMTLNPLLNNAHYDVQHRAYKMAEKRQELQPLRLRYHEVSPGKMRYDARYTPYIQQLGLLPFIHMVTRSTLAFNPAAITALVDRWRPETHTFHLRTGETTITLQDMSMILALPIEWGSCSVALAQVVGFFDSTFSWGSAALAWLYRQLDDACLRSAADSGIGGCLLLLSVWSWERFSIGRPRLLSLNPYIDNGNDYLLPTWAYKWDVVSEPPTDPLEAYKRYTNEFDTITMDQIVPPEWKDTDIGLHSLDRKKQRKEKDWPKLHRKHLEKFRRCVTEARKAKGAHDRPFNRDAFNNYIAWFVDNARVEIYPREFRDSILEEPLVFDELSTEQYNIMVREGRQTEFAPLVNFVRDHVRKSANACEDALDTYPRGEKGEGLFREFAKKQGQRLRRLSNLLGCRDPEVATPSASWSNTHEGDNSGDHHSTSEDEANTPEPQDEESVPDEMTLGNYTRYKVHERSDYMFKPRQPKKPYTPNPSTTKTKKPKNPYRLEVEDEEEPRRKMPTRRGRGAKTTRGK